MQSFGRDGDPSVDTLSDTQPIDHDLSWVWTQKWSGHINGVDHYPAVHCTAIHYPAIYTSYVPLGGVKP